MKSKQDLKSFFENGDKPNQEQFWALIESYFHKDEPITLEELSMLKSNLATIDKTNDGTETLGNVDTKEQVNAKINFAINALKANAPETYDTLKEIADYIANDSNAEAALLQLINTKLDKPTMTNNYYGLWDDTNKKFVDGGLQADGNKVGIGISPETNLVVFGDNEEGNKGVFQIQTPDSNLKIGGNLGYSWIQSHLSNPLYINHLDNNVIINKTAGKVGIGTDLPSEKLEINGRTKCDGIIFNENSSTTLPKEIKFKDGKFKGALVNGIEKSFLMEGDVLNIDYDAEIVTEIIEGNVPTGLKKTYFTQNYNLFGITDEKLYKSIENITTWEEVTVPNSHELIVGFYEINDELYYLLTLDKLYSSTDAGITWYECAMVNTTVTYSTPKLLSLTLFKNEILVTTSAGVVFKSYDKHNFEAFTIEIDRTNPELPNDYTIDNLFCVFQKNNKYNLIASTSAAGHLTPFLFTSEDGIYWTFEKAVGYNSNGGFSGTILENIPSRKIIEINWYEDCWVKKFQNSELIEHIDLGKNENVGFATPFGLANDYLVYLDNASGSICIAYGMYFDKTNLNINEKGYTFSSFLSTDQFLNNGVDRSFNPLIYAPDGYLYLNFNDGNLLKLYYPTPVKREVNSIKGVTFNGSLIMPDSNNIVNISQKKYYSAEETKTGEVWIDGKPIYRKILRFHSPIEHLQVGIHPKAETIVSLKGNMRLKNSWGDGYDEEFGENFPLEFNPYGSTSSTPPTNNGIYYSKLYTKTKETFDVSYIQIFTKYDIQPEQGTFSFLDAYIIIEYTKTN